MHVSSGVSCCVHRGQKQAPGVTSSHLHMYIWNDCACWGGTTTVARSKATRISNCDVSTTGKHSATFLYSTEYETTTTPTTTQQHHQQPGHNPPLTRNIFTLSLLFSNNMNYMNDSTAGSTMDDCPSTYFDLLFWCIFFVVPITAGWTLFLWRSFLHRELYNLYNKNPATSTTTTSSSSSSAKVLPIQARVVDKQARTVHEYRRSNLDPFQAEREAFPVAPFFLTVQYTPDATSGTRTTG